MTRLKRNEGHDEERKAGVLLPDTVEERSALLTSIFAQFPEGMAFVGADMVIRAANEIFAKRTRVPLDQIIGRPAKEAVPLTLRQAGHIYEEVRKTGKPFRSEGYPFTFEEPRGTGLTYWDFTVSPVYGDDGSFLGYLLLVREPSERKRTAAVLRESEMRFRKVFEEGPLGMAIVGFDYRILRANAMACRILGYTERELTKLTFVDVTLPEDVAKAMQVAEWLSRGEIPYYQAEEKRCVKKDGEIVWISHTTSVISDGEGRPMYGLVMFQDITERKRAEAERERLIHEVAQLAEMARRRAGELETVIASIVDGVFVCDNAGRITEVNGAETKLLGLAGKDEAHLPAVEYLRRLNLRDRTGRPLSEDEFALTRALRGEIVRGWEEIATDVSTGRDIYLLVSAAPLHDQTGKITGAVEAMSDITRMKGLDKLKDQFIATAAHELKTPVAIMKGYAEALLRPPETVSARQRKMLEAIDRGAKRIDNIVQEMLAILRLQQGRLVLEPERFDLTELIHDVVDRVAITAAKHRLIFVHSEPAVVYADREHVEQVIVNLLDNAIKYSPRGGEVDVSVMTRDHEAVVSVTDRGIGIPKEKHRDIFQQFYSAHSGTPHDYGGMGVGLYVSNEIVTRHGGRMWFKSEEGKGSTFYFSLPLD